MGTIFERLVDSVGSQVSAKKRQHVNQLIEFGLGVALNDGFEGTEKRFDDVATHRKREVADLQEALDADMFFEPSGQASADGGMVRELSQHGFRLAVSGLIESFEFQELEKSVGV